MFAGRYMLELNGMHCNFCESRVENVLQDLDGVMKVKADHRNGDVEVRVTPKASEEEIKEKVGTLGYEVV
jgi:copper chaperone